MSTLLDAEIMIVGAGPAGVTAARTLAPSHQVAIIDPVFAGAKTKPCGGLLSEAAQASLASFGLTLPLDLLVTPQCFAVRVVDLETRRSALYPRTYTNLDRRRFDDWLRATLPDGVEKISARLSDIVEEDDHYVLTLREQDEERLVRCRYIVGADGGGSLTRRRLFPERRPHLLTAVQAHYDLDGAKPEYACYYDRRVTPAFGWSLAKDDALIIGGAFSREHSGEAFSRFEANVFRHFGYRIGERRFTEACPVVWGRNGPDVFLGVGRAFFIGEAAGLISPSSFEGISFALESGYLLGRSFTELPDLPDRRYQRAVAPLLRKLFVRRAKTSVLASRLMREFVIRSGLDQVNPKDL
ncbi:MAG TPA: hypothetical protein GXZ89_08015 [Fastidiosipila sp.]|nr:hypothetical protein [Fastidiosipila sp.]